MTVCETFGLRKREGDLGVEIEVEGHNLPGNVSRLPQAFTKFWKLEHDGSLRGNENYEYVLKKPLSFKDVEDALTVLSDQYKKDGSRVDDSVRAGIHVHTNCQHLSMKQLFTVITTYFVVENLLTKFCGEGRQGNHFCLRSSDAEYQVMAIINSIQTTNWNYLSDDNIRYSAMNVCALGKYGSLEYRAMRTTSDKTRILNWCKLLLKLRDVYKKFDNPREVIFAVSQDGERAFLQTVFGDMHKILDKSNVADDIMEGVRHAQDIAFCTDWNVWKDNPMKARKIPRLKIRPEGILRDDVEEGQDNG